MPIMGFIGIMLGLYWVHIGVYIYIWFYRDNGKENGSCYSILGLYKDKEKEMEAAIMGYIPLHCHFKVLFVDSALRRSKKRGSYHNGDTHGT